MAPEQKPAEPRTRELDPWRAALFPLGFAAGVFAFLLLPPVRAASGMAAGFLAAGTVLVAWAAWLAVGRPGALEFQIVPRKHHWVQACAQGTLLTYWGLHVDPVLAYVPFIFGQLLFAYGLDALINWTRRRSWQMGFGPIPIVLSINFFLWFKPEWFYWQFVVVALGYAAKELIRWERDGRTRHIFNPSSFPLAVFSLVLIVTGTTDLTFGREIAATLFNPPHMYLAIFLVALPAQMIFGVTTMTIASVATAYVWGMLFFAATGTYYFRDAFIPIAVFLGMHLLFTDPSTSPRTEAGRVIFGVLYAAFTIALAALLEAVGAPTFFDKLLPIPVLNLMVRRIDRVAIDWMDRAGRVVKAAPRFATAIAGPRYRLSVVGLWVATFTAMSASGGLGDDHPGQFLPFWQGACESGSARACEYLAVMQETYCDEGSGWACNELAVREADAADPRSVVPLLRRSCDLEFETGCRNLESVTNGGGDAVLARAEPELRDLPIVLRGSKGPVSERRPEALYALGCAQGWSGMCGERSAEAPG